MNLEEFIWTNILMSRERRVYARFAPLTPLYVKNVMLFHQNIDVNMKLRYSLIIIKPQIDQITSNFDC